MPMCAGRTVGNVSLLLWPLLTWSLGCTTVLSPSLPPRISIARFAITCTRLQRLSTGIAAPQQGSMQPFTATAFCQCLIMLFEARH